MDKVKIYADNNSTTIMPPEVMKELIRWCNKGNPSSAYKSAKESRELMNDLRTLIGRLCKINPCCEEPRDRNPPGVPSPAIDDPTAFKIIFTSGASESNCMVITGAIISYTIHKKVVPHIVVSAIEHKSIINCVEDHVKRKLVTATYVPSRDGVIHPDDVKSALQPNTCLVCVMHANNETGAVNPIEEIGKVAHDAGIPYHCDTVQTFGRYPVIPGDLIDSFCASFHKIHGAPGIGILVIKQQFLHGYKILPLIYGTQNEGYRGGTENIPGIGAAHLALKLTLTDRKKKLDDMLKAKRVFINELSKYAPVMTYQQYCRDLSSATGGLTAKYRIVLLSGIEPAKWLVWTILLSFVPTSDHKICNVEMRKWLENRGIIVGIGSACNTSSAKASHVLYDLRADKAIRAGVLRISFDHTLSPQLARELANALIGAINAQLGTK